jgi:TolB protein
MNADGSGITRLTHDSDPNDMPDWSPDGSKIAYHRYEPLGTGAVYIMASDGTGATRMTNGGGAPAWSPDGKFIAYSGVFLLIMKVDDRGTHVLTSNVGYEPAWSPR